MSNHSPNHSGLSRLSPDEWIARREASIEKIGALLAEREATVYDVADHCGLVRETARSHLGYMEGLGLAHRTGVRVANREYWAAGEKPEPVEQPTAPVQRVVVNVRRDELVEALFGPARRAA